jgi:BASS family bile acid:Na+ symporter
VPVIGFLPDWLLSVVVVVTVFTIMFDLGLVIERGELAWVAQRPGLLLRSLFSVLVVVPAVAWIVAQAVDLPHPVEIGIMLMAISPGPPVSLRASLRAGGHRSFAPALHFAAAALAVVSMPISIAVFDEYYGGNAAVAPQTLAYQVFTAQLLPLALGMLMGGLAPALAGRFEPMLHRIGGVLLALFLVMALNNMWEIIVGAGVRAVAVIVIVTLLALAAGHLLGGPEAATRTATAISSGARNPGLALLVAQLNAASPTIKSTVVVYLFVAAGTVIAYAAWRRRQSLRRLRARAVPHARRR